jgi:hypothetical protein
MDLIIAKCVLHGLLVHIRLGCNQGLPQGALMACWRANVIFIVELLGDRTQPHVATHQQVPCGWLRRYSNGFRNKKILRVIKVLLRVSYAGSTCNLVLHPL